MVFQWFPYDNQEAFDKVAVSFSEDDGFSWTAPCLIKVNGLPEEYMRPFDPTIVTLSDGFFRLYFTSQPYPYRQPLIYSAVSQDAINYTFEPGVRSVDAQGSVVDCSVIRVADVWHLYAHYQSGPDMQQGGPIIMRYLMMV